MAILFFVGLSGGVAGTQEDGSDVPEESAPASPPAPPPVPGIPSRAWALVDLESGEYLAGEGADRRLAMASTTKVVTALVALEMVEEGEASLDEEVAVSAEAAYFAQPIYSNIGLQVGETLTVRELLLATLIPSGDDAAHALAEHLGGGDEAGVERFVARMNAKAKELNLRQTRFANPTGLDEEGHHTSARDLAAATRVAYDRYPLFAETVALPSTTVTTQYREIYLQNTNELLSVYPKAIGVKTGTTPAAGPSLVSAAREGDESYVAVVLGARGDRFADSIRALEHGFDTYDRGAVVRRGERYAEVGVPYRREEEIKLLAKEGVEGLVGGGRKVEMRVKVGGELPESVEAGERLGEVVAYVDGERVGASALVAERGYEEASVWERVWYTAEGLFD